MGGRLQRLLPIVTAWWLALGFRPRREFDRSGPAVDVAEIRRVLDRTERRSLPRPRIRLRPEGRHPPAPTLPARPYAAGRIQPGRRPAQERLLRGLRRREAMSGQSYPIITFTSSSLRSIDVGRDRGRSGQACGGTELASRPDGWTAILRASHAPEDVQPCGPPLSLDRERGSG